MQNNPSLDRELERIPRPGAPSNEPDDATKDELSDAKHQFGLLIKSILLAVFSVGVICIAASAAADKALIVMRLGKTQSDEMLQHIEVFSGFVASVGVELATSAILIYVLFYWVDKCGNDIHKLRYLMIISAFGILLVVIPMHFIASQSFWSDTAMAVGVEIIGWLVIYASLDSVVDALQRNGKSRKRNVNG